MPDPLDRAWPRRPLVSPPPFGLSVPTIWKETSVTFLRRMGSLNAVGGRGGAAEAELLTVMASVSIATDTALMAHQLSGVDSGPIRRRYYLCIFDTPPNFDWSKLPAKGDYMAFTDPAGRTLHVIVKLVDIAEGIRDHVEIESEEFE